MEIEVKKILFVTGTRADFGKLKALIQEVSKSKEFEPHIFCTGMHMLARYGSTVNEIRKSGFKNIYTYINQDGSNNFGMDVLLANTILGLTYYTREFPPNLIVVHGDRIEALAGVIVGALNNILVAHIEGGEVSGTIDGLIRHAITKLAHIHFVSNEEARRRLIQMGEIPETIFVIGSPDIDIMLSDNLPSLSKVRNRYGINFSEYAIFIYHPVTTEIHLMKRNIGVIREALEASNLNFVVIYPNNDNGSHIIFEAYEHLANNAHFRFLPSMRFEYFLSLLKNAMAVVGNSSAGIREAPVYGVPTLNIGSRQNNRFNHTSIVNLSENKEEIISALRNIPRKELPSMHFGNGKSAEMFIRELKSPQLWKMPCQKQFRDLDLILSVQ